MKNRKNFPFFSGSKNGLALLSWMMFCACECLCTVYPLSWEKQRLEFCISGWNVMLQPYIESAVALSDLVKIVTRRIA